MKQTAKGEERSARTDHLVKYAFAQPALGVAARVELLVVPLEALPVLFIELAAVCPHLVDAEWAEAGEWEERKER
jgi:hypothetical protein